jgi:hypothetical protein
MKSVTWIVLGSGLVGAALGLTVIGGDVTPAVSPKEKALQAPAAPAGCHAAQAEKMPAGHCTRPGAGGTGGGGCCKK